MPVQTFYPSYGADFDPTPSGNQRFRNAFNDKRLERVHYTLQQRMAQRRTCVISQLADSQRQKESFLNFVNNDKVTSEELIHHATRLDVEATRDQDILLLEDATTVEVGLGSKQRAQQLQDMGMVGGGTTPGYTLLPCLAIEATSGRCFGLGEVVLHSRPAPPRGKKARQRQRYQRRHLPLEQKDTGAWVLAAKGAGGQLSQARRRTVVMDQGGDVYSVLAELLAAEEQLDVLVRAKYDRQVDGGGEVYQKISEVLAMIDGWPASRTVQIRALNHHSKTKAKRRRRRARKAKLQVRATPIKLLRPESADGNEAASLALNVVEVVEHDSTVPKGESAIRWCLLTTWPIDTIDELWQVVEAYQKRWHIEQLFRTLKLDGLNLEVSQLRQGDRLKRLGIMALQTSVEVMQLVNARNHPEAPIEELFDESDQLLLHKFNSYYEGSTELQKNPHGRHTLAYASWVIGRLGGWSGYKSLGSVGPKRMHIGLTKFREFSWAARITKDL